MTFDLPAINTPRDAADIMRSVAEAVAGGVVTPNEAAEYSKVISSYVAAYHAAELDDRLARVEQLTDDELMRIASTSPLLINGR